MTKTKGKKRGAGTVLTEEEEKAIVKWVKDCAKLGSPLSKQDVIEAAIKFAKTHPEGSRTFNVRGMIASYPEVFFQC